ncbi:uncharacterized protein LOC111292795 [Durio zibethinus]|uniref:Uncharacterized protein LOC111292795 n=1 Tax=Durio zibethinus TaxID=66656 RepID=A0A6P5YKS0_DURZI|nr:uncharacterized protein LOC111292795 [Durio zibethinus]
MKETKSNLCQDYGGASEALARMESEKNQAEIQTPTSSCQRVKSDKNAGFVANMRDQFSEFIHAPIDEHKACFIETFRKAIDDWDWHRIDTFDNFTILFPFQKKD